MLTKMTTAIAVAAVLGGGFLGAEIARAQDAPSALADQLKSQYKLAKVGMDANGWSVTEAGTVLVIQKGGILGVPPANLAMAAATYKDGELHGPNGFAAAMVGKVSRYLTVGEKIYIFKMDVSVKNDKISLMIIECDSCNGVQQPSSYKSQVFFQFPKGYLGKAGASQVQDVISQVLAPEAAPSDAPQSQPQQQAAPSQPASDPPTIQIGQTIDQVKAAWGPPERIVDLGKKQIYIYKDLKITFIDGKVSDVQ
jgi:hypothetical protein